MDGGAAMTLFDGFEGAELDTPRGVIHAQVGGDGPPLLLLHGFCLLYTSPSPRDS